MTAQFFVLEEEEEEEEEVEEEEELLHLLVGMLTELSDLLCKQILHAFYAFEFVEFIVCSLELLPVVVLVQQHSAPTDKQTKLLSFLLSWMSLLHLPTPFPLARTHKKTHLFFHPCLIIKFVGYWKP